MRIGVAGETSLDRCLLYQSRWTVHISHGDDPHDLVCIYAYLTDRPSWLSLPLSLLLYLTAFV